MLALIAAISSHEADQVESLLGKACHGGGPVVETGSACVDVRFEFPAFREGGGLEKSILAKRLGDNDGLVVATLLLTSVSTKGCEFSI